MDRSQEVPTSRPAYFWWFLVNMLALCFAVTSWVVCLHVFGNPEIPRNYAILKWMGRLPEIKRYSVLNAPNGDSMNPVGIYTRFRDMDDGKRKALNAQLLRNYLTNFEHERALTYVEGVYQVKEIRLLQDKDFITQGFVVRARAMVRPDEHTKPVPYPVMIDHVFPTTRTDVMSRFRSGDLLEIKKSPNCAAILHVGKIEDEEDELICLTVVPIAYGPYQVGEGFSFEIEPPAQVEPGATFPSFEK